MPEPRTTSTVVVSPSSRKKLRDGMCSREYLRVSLFQLSNCADQFSCRCAIWWYCPQRNSRYDGRPDRVHRRHCGVPRGSLFYQLALPLVCQTSRLLPNNSPGGYRSNARRSGRHFLASIILLSMLLTMSCHMPERPVPELIQPVSANSQSAASMIPSVTPAMAVLPAPDLSNTRSSDGLYTVSVNQVAASEVLLSLARDTQLDLAINGSIDGQVTMNAVSQPLSVILEKMEQQVPIRYAIKGKSVTVSADVPYIKSYQVDYLNINRHAQSSVSLATQIGSLKTDIDDEGPSNPGSNGSTMRIQNESANSFWDSLVANIEGIIGDSAQSSDTQEAGGGNIFVNRESGFLSVRATGKQHKFVESLITRVVDSAQRQVLIEATVVEVTLNDSFESGVDWQILDNNDGTAVDFVQLLTGSPAASEATTPETSILSYRNDNSRFGAVSATIKLLQQFGDVQVLSNPKIIALNNQPAVLKVVDNRVYFTFEIDRIERENGDDRTVVDSTIHSVPVGLVMSVTPFINDTGEVILNVRPTISRILNFASDPSPSLAGQNEVRNLIPEIQVREMESLLRVQSGDVAIIGGLMQNRVDDRNVGIPLIGTVPILGKVFSRTTRSVEKTELLVFLRPTVLKRNTSAQYEQLLERPMERSINSLPTDFSQVARPLRADSTRRLIPSTQVSRPRVSR